MEIKILFFMLVSLLVFINSVSLNDHQMLSSHDLAQGHEHLLGVHAMPRKLMLNPKVESIADKDMVSYSADLSGEPHNGGGGKEEATPTIDTSSKVSMKEGSYTTRMFTMDYTSVRRRRPVHNKSVPTTTTSP